MREKIVSIFFVVIIMAIPLATIGKNLLAEKEVKVEVQEEGSLAELNREEQLLMQEGLQKQDETVEPAGQEEADTETTMEETEESEEADTEGNSLKEYVDSFTSGLAFSEQVANANHSITSALADDTYIDSDQVLAGKGGWLFYKRADDGTPLKDYEGTSTFSDGTMESIKNSLESQRDIFAEKGIRFVVMIIPNKEIIYAEYMPSTVYRTSEITRCDKLYEYLKENSDLEIVYPKLELFAAKETNQVYFKYDTHWNSAGAYVGIQCLLRQLYGTYVDIANVNVREVHHNRSGDLAMLIGMQDKYCDDLEDAILQEDMDISQMSSDKVLIIGDSFGEFMLPQMRYYFPQVDHVGVWTFKMDMLEAYQPDIVVWESVERYADRLSWITLTEQEATE